MPRVYIVQDAEWPTHNVITTPEGDELHVQRFGSGEEGAVRTGVRLANPEGSDSETGVDVRLGRLPRPGLDKMDVDEYLREWAGADGLAPILRSARPVTAHPLADEVDATPTDSGAAPGAHGTAGECATPSGRSESGGGSGLSIHDVIPANEHPAGEQSAHPVHGSTTGTNFHVFEDGETWYCHREGHKCGGNADHLLGMILNHFECGEWERREITAEEWREVYDDARERRYDLAEPPSRRTRPTVSLKDLPRCDSAPNTPEAER